MHLGIFAKTFPRPTLEETLDAIADRGFSHVQFNMSCAGLPTLPERLDEDRCIWIAREIRRRGMTMAAISGTFNLCDPDHSRFEENLHRLGLLAAACRWLDTRIITLCTGTLDPDDMWAWHPDNVRRSTWESLIESMRQAVQIADRYEVTLAFEPEINNIVNSVSKARRLLDEIGSPWLKVVIDPANLMRAGDFSRMNEILSEAFDWLGSDIVLAHAKNPANDRNPDETLPLKEDLSSPASEWLPDFVAGQIEKLEHLSPKPILRIIVDRHGFYDWYIKGLNRIDYSGALVIHGLPEQEVADIQGLLVSILKRSR